MFNLIDNFLTLLENIIHFIIAQNCSPISSDNFSRISSYFIISFQVSFFYHSFQKLSLKSFGNSLLQIYLFKRSKMNQGIKRLLLLALYSNIEFGGYNLLALKISRKFSDLILSLMKITLFILY